jgi:thiamine transport system permease protein
MTATTRRGSASWVIAALLATTLGVVMVWPVLTLLSAHWSPAGIVDVLRGSSAADRQARSAVVFTVVVAVTSSALTVGVGVPLVEIIARSMPGARVARALLIAPFALPSVVVASALRASLPDAVQPGWTAILIAHLVFNLSVVVRLVGDRRAQIDERLLAAATTAGFGPWRSWWVAVFPALRASVVQSALLVAAFCATSYGVVVVLGDSSQRTIDILIVRELNDRLRLDRVATLVVLQLPVLAALLLVAAQAGRHDTPGRGVGGWTRRPRIASTYAAWSLVLLVVALPLVVMTLRSVRIDGRWSLAALAALTDPLPGSNWSALASLGVSARAALLAAAVTGIVGAAAGLVMAGGGTPGRIVSAITALPLALSAVVIGVAMLVEFDSDWGDLRSRWFMVPIAHAIAALPIAARLVATARRRIDPRLLVAAATLGLSPWQRGRWVLAPLLRRSVIASTGVSAAISLGDFGAASVLARTGAPPVPVAIGRLLGRPGAEPFALAMALSVVLALACAGLALLETRR